jgi:hypothetical protein
LHVLGTPPAFVLSQDQTLRREPLDPAPFACLGPVSGSMLESRPSPGSTPGSAFLLMLFRTTVEPTGAAIRTSRDQRGKRTGFWHTVQFSRCGRRPEGRDSKEWGRATHHGRQTGPRRQPNICPDPTVLRCTQSIPVGGGARTTVRYRPDRGSGSVFGRYTLGATTPERLDTHRTVLRHRHGREGGKGLARTHTEEAADCSRCDGVDPGIRFAKPRGPASGSRTPPR